MKTDDDRQRCVHHFGKWRFDKTTGDLGDGQTVHRLEPQVGRLLGFFLDHQGLLISRDDLNRDVWDGRVVSDHAVNRCVSKLRSALTPKNRNAFIETVVRRGFIAHFPPPLLPTIIDIKRSPGLPLATKTPLHQAEPRPGWILPLDPSSGWRLNAILLLLLLILTTLFAQQYFGEGSRSAIGLAEARLPMIAVLPFACIDQTQDSELFASGIHDDLLAQLARFEGLRVISRTSVLEYAGREINLKEIGRQLGADAILEGSVQQVEDRIRINVQLIDADTDTHLWGEQYDRGLTPVNLFEVQSEIARAVAKALNAELSGDVGAPMIAM